MYLVQWSKDRQYSTISFYSFYLYDVNQMAANSNLNNTLGKYEK